MNRQKHDHKVYAAFENLRNQFPEMTKNLLEDQYEYWAYPEVFGSTNGPFSGVGCRVLTTFTIEAFVWSNLAVLFCQDKIIKVTDQ